MQFLRRAHDSVWQARHITQDGWSTNARYRRGQPVAPLDLKMPGTQLENALGAIAAAAWMG